MKEEIKNKLKDIGESIKKTGNNLFYDLIFRDGNNVETTSFGASDYDYFLITMGTTYQTHGTFGDHPDSATISINKISNL